MALPSIITPMISAEDDDELYDLTLFAKTKRIINTIHRHALQWVHHVLQCAILTIVPLVERFRPYCNSGSIDTMRLSFFSYKSHQILTDMPFQIETDGRYYYPIQHVRSEHHTTTLHCNNDTSVCYCKVDNSVYLDDLIMKYHILPVLSAHIGKNVWVEVKDEEVIFEQYGIINNTQTLIYRILRRVLVLRYYPEGLPEYLRIEQDEALELYGFRF